MKSTFIYALKCPISGLIRYVGKSDNPKKRFPRHLQDARSGEVYHRAVWIRAVLAQKLKPLLEIIDEVDDGVSEGLPLEAAYIQFFRDEGCDLTNATPGGEAGPSLPGALNPNFGKHIHCGENNPCFGRTGEKHPMFGRVGALHPMFGKTGEQHPMFGHKHAPDAIEKIKAKRATQVLTEERNAKISTSVTGDKHPFFGQRHSEEARAKIKAARAIQTANNRSSGRLPKNCKIYIGAF